MSRPEVIQIFVSHTRLDKQTCDEFDVAAARVGIKVFRSEYEDLLPPAWKTIRDEIRRSSALFFLVGPNLVKYQEMSRGYWKYTQNWIAFEIGLACAFDKDVWVLCDGVNINFPVPYLNNYCPGIIDIAQSRFEVGILSLYQEGRFSLNTWGRGVQCPYKDCGSTFNLHMSVPKGKKIICPTCLRHVIFNEDWLIAPTVGSNKTGLYVPEIESSIKT